MGEGGGEGEEGGGVVDNHVGDNKKSKRIKSVKKIFGIVTKVRTLNKTVETISL